MGFLTSKLEDELRSMTVEQLRAFALEHGVSAETTPQGFTENLTLLKGKDLLVHRLSLTNTPASAVTEFKAAWKARKSDEKRESATPAASTPTLAPTRTVPLVSFEEVVAYLEQYRFISRYTEELHYEIELAGALREKFGTVIRQFPVPGSHESGTRPRVIDLDVNGTGIEVKYALKGDKNWAALDEQMARYRPHYGERVITLLIGVEANDDHRVNRLRGTGVVVVVKG